MEDKAVRFNMSLSSTVAQKLEDYSKKCGLPKSTIVAVALTDYFQQREMMDNGINIVMELIKNDPEFFKKFIIDEDKK